MSGARSDNARRVERHLNALGYEPRIVLFCCEDGFGKSTLLARMHMRYAERGIPTKREDFGRLEAEEANSRLKELYRWCMGKPSATSEVPCRALIACDNFPVGDEADIARTQAIVARLVAEGGSLALSMAPEGEVLAEQLAGASCFWSCDLCLAKPHKARELRLYEEFSHGIPLLEDALKKVEVTRIRDIPCDPCYQEPFTRAIEATVHATMMAEEKRLRCAMLLLGCGTRLDLEAVVGPIDEVVWRLIPRDSPFFGVNVSRQTFSCVGSAYADCLNVAYATLRTLVRPWPSLVAQCARMLAERGEVSRSALVGLMCADDRERCAAALEWGPRIIDAGEVNVATDALETATAKGMMDLEGFWETYNSLRSVLGDEPASVAMSFTPLKLPTLTSRHAHLAVACEELAQSGHMKEMPVPEMHDDRMATLLVVHLKAMTHMLGGHLQEAYDLLIQNVVLQDAPTVSSSLVEVDYLLCSTLMGIVPGDMGADAMDAIELFLERSGLTRLARLHDAALLMGMLASGRLGGYDDLETYLQRATRRKEPLFEGVLLLATGVSDMRAGILTRAHVRLRQATGAFDELDLPVMSKISRLFHYAVRAQLGERIARSELAACEGVSPVMDGVVAMLGAALSASRLSRFSASSGWSVAGRVHEVFWIVNVLANDCGIVSRRFRKVMPGTWFDTQLRCSAQIDDFFGRRRPQDALPENTEEGDETHRDSLDAPKDERGMVEVCVMGGFEVIVEGVRLPETRLDRRNAKTLLALLAAVPGHAVKRFMLMESIWPAYDYQSANKSLYSATSSLRTELVSALGATPEIPLVVSNKSQGTVALNASVFRCDVDAFEERARQLQDRAGEDRELVALCREIEDLYKGDLYIPTMDGMGIMQTRSTELRMLFADAMISGARAALRLDMRILACRFARRAHEADDVREDAIRILVAALCAAGRHVEAERYYERFVGRVVDLTRRPPSRLLRATVEDLLKGLSLGTIESHRGRGQTRAPRVRLAGGDERQAGIQLAFAFDDCAE